MNNTFVRRFGVPGLGVVTVALAFILVKQVSASPSAVLDACINPGNGMMRLVDASTACHANESRVEWNVTGPQGPAGPQGPQGPQGLQGPAGSSAGGPPFVWVCTPVVFAAFGDSGLRADLYVFNGSSTTANVAVHLLDQAGNNLAGVTIPGLSPSTYPGQTGSATVAVPSLSTLDVQWPMPADFPETTANIAFTATVTSDQPIVVGVDLQDFRFKEHGCNLLPR